MIRLEKLLSLSAALVAVLTACSCSQSGLLRTTDAVAPQASNTSNSENPQPEPKPTPKVLEAEAYLSGAITMKTVDRKETNSRFS